MIGKSNMWMVCSLAPALAVACLAGDAISQDAARGKFSGEYFLYGGTLDDRTLPTRKDAKVGMWVSGTVAAQMFRHLGPASRINFCDDGKAEARSRGELICSRDRDTGKAQCYFGFDLHSGKSIGAIIC